MYRQACPTFVFSCGKVVMFYFAAKKTFFQGLQSFAIYRLAKCRTNEVSFSAESSYSTNTKNDWRIDETSR